MGKNLNKEFYSKRFWHGASHIILENTVPTRSVLLAYTFTSLLSLLCSYAPLTGTMWMWTTLLFAFAGHNHLVPVWAAESVNPYYYIHSFIMSAKPKGSICFLVTRLALHDRIILCNLWLVGAYYLLTLSSLSLPLSSSSTTSRELLSQFSTCSGWKWHEVDEKLKGITMYS